MTKFMIFRLFLLLRRFVKVEEERLAYEKLRYERDYPPLPAERNALKAEISKANPKEWNQRHANRYETYGR